MNGDLVLAIDNGTQSVRALIFDSCGNLIAKSRIMIEPYYSTAPGFAEQDPSIFWNALIDSCQELWHLHHIDKSRIAGVAITTQRSTVINVDKDGNPLRPAIVWLDQRRTEGCKPVGGLWGLGFALTGMSETVAYLQAEGEVNWLRKNQPEIWKNTYKYLFLSGYLTYKLVGKFVDSIGCQVGYIPFDYKNLDWSKKSDWKWQAVPIEKEKLPELIQPGKILGYITAEAAEITGIPKGIPLIAAAADKSCEVLGAGCLDPHIACLSFGTTATTNTTNQKYVEAIPLIPPYPAAIPNMYSLEIQIYRGYWMVSWFKREFGFNEERLAKERGIETEEVFDELANSVPPGSMGLMLQPFWSPGLKIPGPEAKGAIIGFGDVHTRSHLYRAILEGLSYALREGAERIEHRNKIPITEIRIAGGGSQSDAAMQLTSDIFGISLSKPHVYEASGLGAAIDAAVGLGFHPDFNTAVEKMTRIGKTFQPIEENHLIYDELYKRVYTKMYSHLKPLYHEIRNITGYPLKF